MPRLQFLHTWLQAQRGLVSDGTATAKALDYALKRWSALVRYAQDGHLPIDNNLVENRIRPWAAGRKIGSSAAASQPGNVPARS